MSILFDLEIFRNLTIIVIFLHFSHCTRACDTLRVILTNFLPLIKENSSSWAAHSLGVDISSEERWKKCNECRKWLLMIRSIPDNRHVSNALGQLQNLIVDL